MSKRATNDTMGDGGPDAPTDIVVAQRRRQHLLDITRLLACFQSVERTLPELFALFAKALPLESAVVILATREDPQTFAWQLERSSSEQLDVATSHARSAYDYLIGEGRELVRATGRTFVILPLASVCGTVFGALQIEGTNRVGELDLAFMDAIVNRLSGALEARNAIQSRRPAARTRRRLDALGRSAAAMSRFLVDVLDTASLESGHLSVASEPIAVDSLVGAALDATRHRTRGKRLHLRSDIADGVDAVYVDGPRIATVFERLLESGVRCTPADGTILVRASAAGDDVLFCVTDGGGNIGNGGGSGLGRYVVKGTIEAHGGRVWSSGRSERRETFFTLPTKPSGASAMRRAPALLAEQHVGCLVELIQGLDLRQRSPQTALESTNVGHELALLASQYRRDLMTVLGGALDSMPLEAEPLVGSVLTAMSRLTALIDTVRRCAQRGGSAPRSDLATCNLRSVVERVLDDLRFRAAQNQLVLQIRAVTPLPPLRRDPILLRLLIRQLVADAISCSGRGGVEVILAATAASHSVSIVDMRRSSSDGEVIRRSSVARMFAREVAAALGAAVETSDLDGGSALTIVVPKLAEDLRNEGLVVH